MCECKLCALMYVHMYVCAHLLTSVQSLIVDIIVLLFFFLSLLSVGHSWAREIQNHQWNILQGSKWHCGRL